MRMFTVAGIDPGISGGITILANWKNIMVPNKGGGGYFDVEMLAIPRVVISVPMPTLTDGKKNRIDPVALRVLFQETEVDHIAIEKVGAMPGQGVTSMFSFGHGCGLIEGVVSTLHKDVDETIEYIPYEFVTPQAWMKVCFVGMAKGEHKASPLYCQRRFPNQDWRATTRSKKAHDGMTDSACIADYLLKKLSA